MTDSTKKLVRIKDVYLSTTNKLDSTTTANCDAARQFLKDSGIKFQELWYKDEKIDERTPVLTALSTWTWKGNRQKKMEVFPILHWTECYDDWSTEVDYAHGIDEIKNALTLLNNKDLIA